MIKIKRLLLSCYESLIRNISGSIGEKIRYHYYSKRFESCGINVIIKENVFFEKCEFISVGDNTLIDRNVLLLSGEAIIDVYKCRKMKNKHFKLKEGFLKIGSNVHIAPNCIIQSHAGVDIGDNVGISSGTKIYSLINLPNNSKDLSEIIHFTNRTESAYYLFSPVRIFDNVGLSLNSTVLPGVSILENSFVTPYSVVMTSVKENSVVSGNPAKRIKNRFVI